MTRKQVKNLCAEFGIEMISFPRRMYYRDYLVGSFYPDKGNCSYKMSFIGSCVKTDNWYKDLNQKYKLEKIQKDFK